MTRILFVDDDPKVLDGLRSLLRAFRREWNMEFCESPEHALAMMSERVANEPFDVIVTDMRMPGMDGAELLTRVRDLYPDTVRIVMSGQSAQERILRAVGPAHQYMSKPCDPEVLRATVTRASLLGQRMNDPELKALVSRLDSLPSLPDIYFELVEELRSENASVDRVGALVARDVSMTAKVLQLVNSSFFGLPVHVADAPHAAALLGLNTLKPLVLTASIFRQLEETSVSPAFLEKVLSHSMSVAGVAKVLAKEEGLDRESVDNAFIAGALHDIGKIVMADNFGRNYTALCHQAKAQQRTLSSIETEQFGSSHGDVGGYLMGLWGLPPAVIEAIAFHHDPATSVDTEFTLLTAVHAGNVLCAADHRQEASEIEPAGLDLEYLTRLGLAERAESWRALADECAALA